MTRIPPIVLILFSFILFTCKQTIEVEDQLMKDIPADALFTLSISPERIVQKADIKDVYQYSMFSDMLDKLEDSISILSEIFDEPRNSGIDFSRNSYIYILNNPDRKRQFILALLLPLADKASFESLVSATSPVNIQKRGDFQYLLPQKGENVIAWNKDKAMLFGFSRGQRDINAITALFSLSEQNSLAVNNSFVKSFRKDHDVEFFINSNPLVENLPPHVLLGTSFAGISEDALKDNYIFGKWNFDRGEMKMDVNYSIKPELRKHYALSFKERLRVDFSSLIPTENLQFTTNYALDPKGLHQILVEKSLINLVNKYLEASDLGFKELAAALQGDVSFSLYSDSNDENPTKNVLMITPIEDVAVVDQVLEFGVKSRQLKKVNENIYQSNLAKDKAAWFFSTFNLDRSDEFYIFHNGNYLYLFSDVAFIKTIQSGNFKSVNQLSPDIKRALQRGYIGSYTNLKSSLLRQTLDIEGLDYLISTGEGNQISTTILMKDPKVNSLKAILQSLEERHQKRKTRKDSKMESEKQIKSKKELNI